MKQFASAPDAADIKRLAALAAMGGPIMCDRSSVDQLLSKGLVDRTATGWMVSAKGRLNLQMRRAGSPQS